MIKCPKCNQTSGNSWAQCGDWCPMGAPGKLTTPIRPMDGSSGTGASDKLTGRRFSERSDLLGEQRDLGQTKAVSRHGRSSLAEPEPKAAPTSAIVPQKLGEAP